jgi:hypothetical protein
MMAVMEQTEQGIGAPDTAHVQVVLDETGMYGRVVVDGNDLSSRVRAVHLTMEAGRPGQVVLIANTSGFSYDGPGLVRVVEEVSRPWAKDAQAWLDGVDWQALQTEAAAGAMSQSIGDAFHAALSAQLRTLTGGSGD